MNKTNIKSLLKTKQTLLEAKLDVLFSHPVTKGDHCEGAWIDFFRSFLPSKFAVDKGFVFDCEGNISDQIDVIIYDALYSPLIFGTDAGEKFITAESVYAVFDSKPEINKGTIEYTNNKIQSVAKLYRTSRDIINAGKKMPARGLPSIIGGILATRSIEKNAIEPYMREFPYIDVGCAIKKHSFLVKRDKDKKFLSWACSAEEETVLAFFYMILDELYKMGTVPAIDIRDYANATLSNIKLEKEDKEKVSNDISASGCF